MVKNGCIWKKWGLTKSGMVLAEKIMPEIMRVVEDNRKDLCIGKIGETFLNSIVKEALFQVTEIPSKSEKYQLKWKWKK